MPISSTINNAMMKRAAVGGISYAQYNDPMALAKAMQKMMQASKGAHGSLGRAGQSLGRTQKLMASRPELMASRPASMPAAQQLASATGLGTGAGLGAIGAGAATIGASIPALVMIDRAMKKTYGTGLIGNLKEGIKQPIKKAKSGIQFIKEN